jgi:hypothetical protein
MPMVAQILTRKLHKIWHHCQYYKTFLAFLMILLANFHLIVTDIMTIMGYLHRKSFIKYTTNVNVILKNHHKLHCHWYIANVLSEVMPIMANLDKKVL